MNNTSKSNSKAKLIGIIAGLLVVILAIVIAFTFISKPQPNKDTEAIENNTKQNEHYEQQNVDKDIKTSVKDSTYGEAIPEEADQSNEADSVGDMNGDTTEGVEITDEMKSYNESPESTVTEEDNTTEEPKQEDVYVPDNTPQVDNTPADNTPTSSGSDDSFWGSDGGFNDNWNNIDSTEHGSTGWDPAGGWNWN